MNRIFEFAKSIFAQNQENYLTCTGKNTYIECTDGLFRVRDVDPVRGKGQTNIYEGNNHVIELFNENGSITTYITGEYLITLNLSKEIYEKVKANLNYNPRYSFKHYFTLSEEDTKEFLESVKTRNPSNNNGLMKPGEIGDKGKPKK